MVRRWSWLLLMLVLTSTLVMSQRLRSKVGSSKLVDNSDARCVAGPGGIPVDAVTLQDSCSAAMRATAPAEFTITLSTNYGDMSARCKRHLAPVWVDRVYNLGRHGYYDSNYFFRVIASPGLHAVQFGTNGDPSVSNVYNWNSLDLGRCAVLNPQPDKMPVGAPELSNVFGTLSMSTSFNETTGTTWNATAELFINTGDNSRLDAMRFVPICTLDGASMATVLRLPSFGELADLGGPGPSLAELYAKGNTYIAANRSWASMGQVGARGTTIACSSRIEGN